MASNQPPTTVSALVARVTQSVANINAHRTAMAKVAAEVKSAVPAKKAEGVTK